MNTAYQLALVALADLIDRANLMPSDGSDEGCECELDRVLDGSVCDGLECEVQGGAEATEQEQEGKDVRAAHGSGRLGFSFQAGENRTLHDLQVHEPCGWDRALPPSEGVNPEPLRHGLRPDLAKLGDLNGAPKRFDDVG